MDVCVENFNSDLAERQLGRVFDRRLMPSVVLGSVTVDENDLSQKLKIFNN